MKDEEREKIKRKESKKKEEKERVEEEESVILEREEAGIVEEGKKEGKRVDKDKDKVIEELSREKELYFERLLRLQAEFENFRKRVEEERKEFYLMALTDLVGKLLPILDDFERALSVDATDLAKYREGVALIYKGFRSILEGFGLKEVPAVGERFDPRVHQAVMREEVDDVEEETVVEEFRKGYFLKNRLVRPAMVKVAVKKEKEIAPADPEKGEKGKDEGETAN